MIYLRNAISDISEFDGAWRLTVYVEHAQVIYDFML